MIRAYCVYNLVFSCHVLIHCRWYSDTRGLDQFHDRLRTPTPPPNSLPLGGPWPPSAAALSLPLSLTHTYVGGTGQTSDQTSRGEEKETAVFRHLQRAWKGCKSITKGTLSLALCPLCVEAVLFVLTNNSRKCMVFIGYSRSIVVQVFYPCLRTIETFEELATFNDPVCSHCMCLLLRECINHYLITSSQRFNAASTHSQIQ